MSAPEPLVHVVADDEIQGPAAELFTNLKEQMGDVPKWVRVMANQDDILLGFFAMFKATMDDAPVEAKLKWKVAYKVSEINKCAFCVSVSQKKLASMGLGDVNLKDLEEAADEREKVALKFAEDATKEAYKINAAAMDELKKHFSDPEIVELTAVVGLFNYINRFNDALGILPDIE